MLKFWNRVGDTRMRRRIIPKFITAVNYLNTIITPKMISLISNRYEQSWTVFRSVLVSLFSAIQKFHSVLVRFMARCLQMLLSRHWNGNEMKPGVDICECDFYGLKTALLVSSWIEQRSQFAHLPIIQPKTTQKLF